MVRDRRRSGVDTLRVYTKSRAHFGGDASSRADAGRRNGESRKRGNRAGRIWKSGDQEFSRRFEFRVLPINRCRVATKPDGAHGTHGKIGKPIGLR